ncbi:6958_t:CDS:2 [Funneliformis caledonium]|uniref:6958_t:CDS:1 n=1 Tax=Funneliformis caledonium TaxID=1117310 RepID=A0A9N8ZDR4_9GLOM|nr:6958_t:CDS:2 [Funneliformis caledonium]
MKSSEHLISHNEAKLSSITSPVTGISNFSLNSPVDGSYIIDDFITKQEEIELINSIDLHEWSGNGIPPNPEMRRRTQQYGYEFSYRYRKVVQNLGALPTFLDFIIARFVEQKIIQLSEMEYPNMCIVNEYQVGQGIMAHVDSTEFFGPIILSLSLLSPCLMTFTHTQDSSNQSIVLLSKSLLIMTKSSRFDYKHSISKDAIEYYNGDEIIRDRRVSLTFRTIMTSKEEEKGVGTDCC